MTINPVARRQAMELITALGDRNGIALERVLARPDLREIAIETARWCLVAGRASSFGTKAALLAELRRATGVIEESERVGPGGSSG